MSETKLYVGEGLWDDKQVHVLAYQNSARSWGPNAMVLPFPTDVKMTEDNIIDTSEFNTFLARITEASHIRTLSENRGDMLFGSNCVAGKAQVFDVGSYTVVLADNVKQIPVALKRVPENKRPKVSNEFLAGYGELYPKQPIAVCCWDGQIEAEPLLWWYEPRNQDELFIPTMDAHDGQAPIKRQRVKTDHIISTNANGRHRNKVEYHQQMSNKVQNLLPTHVLGHQLNGWMENDDCFIKTDDLLTSHAMLRRGSYQQKMTGWM